MKSIYLPLALMSALLFFVGCDDPSNQCVEGRTASCPCASGTGYQVCESDGTWGDCLCAGDSDVKEISDDEDDDGFETDDRETSSCNYYGCPCSYDSQCNQSNDLYCYYGMCDYGYEEIYEECYGWAALVTMMASVDMATSAMPGSAKTTTSPQTA